MATSSSALPESGLETRCGLFGYYYAPRTSEPQKDQCVIRSPVTLGTEEDNMKPVDLKAALKAKKPVFGFMVSATASMRWERVFAGSTLDFVVIDS